MGRLVEHGAAAAAALVGLGLCLLAPAPLPALVGLPLLLVAGALVLWPPPPWLSRLWRVVAERPWLSWGLPIAGLALLVALAYRPLLLGHMPWAAGQADHPTHLYQAWLLVERLLPSGRLTGWSDLRWAGYPALELYPIGGPLWVALFRLMTGGSLDWEATYALAILGMLFANVLATYVATRRLVGPGAALVAALLVLFERGWPRQGGDHYAVDVGVWPVTLGVGPTLLALERLWTALGSEGRSRARALVAGALLAAAALLAHPFYVAVLVLALPTMATVAVLSGRPARRSAEAVALVGLLGFGIVAFWYLPFLSGSGLSEPGGAPYRSLGNLGEGLATGSMLPGFWPIAAAAATFGALLALRRGGAPAGLAAVALVLLLACSATPLELSERLTLLTRSFQQERLLIVVRVLACVLAGYLCQAVFAAARTRALPSGWRGRVALAASVALLGPLAWPVAEGLLKHLVTPVVELEHGPDLPHRRDMLALCRWMRCEAGDATPAPRTAWHVGYGHHEHAAAPVFCGLAQIVETPAETFAIRPGGISEREVRAFGVRWVVGDRPIEGRDSYLRHVRTFGALHVYEVVDFRYRRVTSLGSARAELVEFHDELVRVRIAGARPGDRVAVHVARHPAWRATLDGEAVAVSGGHLGLPRADLIHVPVRDGLLEVRYLRGASAALGAALTMIAALLLGLAALSPVLGARGRLRARLASGVRVGAAVAAGLALAALLVWAATSLEPRGTVRRSEPRPRPPGTHLAALLDRAEVWLERDGRRERVARRWDGRFGSILPPAVVVDRHVEAIELGDPRRVVAVRVGERETVRLRFPVGNVGRVVGWVARGGRGPGRTRVELLVGGEPAGRVEAVALGRWTDLDLTAPRPAGPLELVVDVEGSSGRAVLLDLGVIR